MKKIYWHTSLLFKQCFCFKVSHFIESFLMLIDGLIGLLTLGNISTCFYFTFNMYRLTTDNNFFSIRRFRGSEPKTKQEHE